MTDWHISIGESVTLKSGGKPMTVIAVNADAAEVAWMDRDSRLRRDSLPVECLRRSDGEFDGIPDLVIEGVTHTRKEIDAYLGRSGNA